MKCEILCEIRGVKSEFKELSNKVDVLIIVSSSSVLMALVVALVTIAGRVPPSP